MAHNTIQNPNGRHYEEYRHWNKLLHQPYDYKNEGLLNRIMSHKIWGTKNPFLKYILRFVESSLIYCMQSADQLAHFYDYNWRNR